MLNFLCKVSDSALNFMLVVDIIIVCLVVSVVLWYSIKYFMKKKRAKCPKSKNYDGNKIDDETYVFGNRDGKEIKEFPDNAVEHFSNQINACGKQKAEELKSNAVVEAFEVQKPVKRKVVKDEVTNYVVVDGVKKKTDFVQDKNVNRGADAYKNATDFVKKINSENKKISNKMTKHK